MNFGTLNPELRFSGGFIGIEAYFSAGTESRSMNYKTEGRINRSITYKAEGRIKQSRRPQPQTTSKKSIPSNYFTLESLLLLLCLTASLLILPLILPPLPPPPSILLLVPIGILVLLLILAFMPSDIQDIASSYL